MVLYCQASTTKTKRITSTNYDTYENYSDAHSTDGSLGKIFSDSIVNQFWGDPDYEGVHHYFHINRSFIFFYTAGWVGKVIGTINLRLYLTFTYNDTIPNSLIVVKSGMPTYPSDPVVLTDFNTLNYPTLIGYSVVPLTNGYFWIPLNNSCINTSGWTKLCLTTGDDYTNTPSLSGQPSPGGVGWSQGWSFNNDTGSMLLSNDEVESTNTTDRIGSIRHVLMPGIYKAELTLGGLSSGIDMPDLYVPKGSLTEKIPGSTVPKAKEPIIEPTITTIPTATDTTPVSGYKGAFNIFPNNNIPATTLSLIQQSISADLATSKPTSALGLAWSIATAPIRSIWNNIFGGK
jgi:hypothetical protein